MIFTHARSSLTIDDPAGLVESGYRGGRFASPCELPRDDADVTGALEAHGTVPVSGVRWLGLATPQLVLAGVAAVLVVGGLILTGISDTPGLVAGVVLTVIGAAIVALTVTSARGRRRRMIALAAAWRNGWLRFAPAEVGAVWIDRVVKHGRKDSRGANQDSRYWYRAEVRVHPTDGTPEFTFTSRAFQALSDDDGVPRDLRTSPNPVDAFEPEYANGWTIVRYVAGEQEDTATVTTNLSEGQIRAALAAAGYAAP
ncbi:MAG: hypothetical protein ACTH1D_08865 [Mycobacteriaceae bacterium]